MLVLSRANDIIDRSCDDGVASAASGSNGTSVPLPTLTFQLKMEHFCCFGSTFTTRSSVSRCCASGGLDALCRILSSSASNPTERHCQKTALMWSNAHDIFTDSLGSWHVMLLSESRPPVRPRQMSAGAMLYRAVKPTDRAFERAIDHDLAPRHGRAARADILGTFYKYRRCSTANNTKI